MINKTLSRTTRKCDEGKPYTKIFYSPNDIVFFAFSVGFHCTSRKMKNNSRLHHCFHMNGTQCLSLPLDTSLYFFFFSIFQATSLAAKWSEILSAVHRIFTSQSESERKTYQNGSEIYIKKKGWIKNSTKTNINY